MADTLYTKKTIAKLGQQMSLSAASKPSSFALKQMKKMGWEEGQGLGKEGTGITKSIEIKKREDNLGLGSTTAVEAIAVATTENWWHDAFSSSLMAFSSSIKTKTGKKKDKDKGKDKKDKKEKKAKRERSEESGPSDSAAATVTSSAVSAAPAPSFDELFIAT
eukprot:gene66147-90541_t